MTKHRALLWTGCFRMLGSHTKVFMNCYKSAEQRSSAFSYMAVNVFLRAVVHEVTVVLLLGVVWCALELLKMLPKSVLNRVYWSCANFLLADRVTLAISYENSVFVLWRSVAWSSGLSEIYWSAIVLGFFFSYICLGNFFNEPYINIDIYGHPIIIYHIFFFKCHSKDNRKANPTKLGALACSLSLGRKHYFVPWKW